MKYYKQNNEVYAYELNGSQDHLIGDKVAMTTEEVELHTNPPKKPEQIQAEIDNAIQNLLDTTAVSFRWSNMQSARAGAKVVNPTDIPEVVAMKLNAQSLENWYFLVWAKAGQIEAEVLAGTRPMPTVDEVLLELPSYEAV